MFVRKTRRINQFCSSIFLVEQEKQCQTPKNWAQKKMQQIQGGVTTINPVVLQYKSATVQM